MARQQLRQGNRAPPPFAASDGGKAAARRVSREPSARSARPAIEGPAKTQGKRVHPIALAVGKYHGQTGGLVVHNTLPFGEVDSLMSGTQRGFIRNLDPIQDGDMDSLFILPLSIIPLETPALKRARMVKNQRLEGVVEFFSDRDTGAGHVKVGDLPKAMHWELDKGIPNDLMVLRRLAPMPSYDVFSLRVLLRQSGIAVHQSQDLKLSPEKNLELAGYMKTFTGPLIQQIYGEDGADIKDFDDIVALFRDPDVKVARAKLKIMARRLDIEVLDIPNFLEDYGDIFLSLSYYRQCLDRLEPHLENFLYSLDILRENWQLRNDTTLMRTCDTMERTLNDLSASITGKFETFDRATQDMWNQISATRFRQVKEMIEGYHTTIGGILCALTVKMNIWATHFPKPDMGGPVKRSEIIMSEMKQGIDTMRRLDRAAPVLDMAEG